jgi:AcrR family transcriptional regulator
MISRAESAASTRRALLSAAGTLLDEGGPEAVTLRAVGAAAGVTRGAPYGHFRDKEDLLTALAVQSWTAVADQLDELRAQPGPTPRDKLELALLAFVATGRRQPHRYALMFQVPTADPDAVVRAASRSQDLFIDLVADVVGRERARTTAALLLVTAHGITGMAVGGHLGTEKWGTGAEELVRLAVAQFD